jgi:hypothetical protein
MEIRSRSEILRDVRSFRLKRDGKQLFEEIVVLVL